MGRFWISIILGLELILCGSAVASARTAGIPDFKIRAICAPEHRAGSDPVDRASYRGCLSDEAAARRTLIKRWATFDVAERRTCRTESQIGGAPSYVAMLTCVQLGSGALPVQPSGRP
ncbi:hypothetical protein SAMN02799622_02841 [Methylobacterium sp. UNC378MF]|uniref:hypothetical protein n=1 Tax=Methylobacterium sp. UNC378MF TaxID=1502748 RepID=UPI00088923F9|nr:hypothetical protein [Methylobacterium sp. UNC378MF]SDA22082.1 hypothetical protein SAMN02799622_02841 [Methylobacterium sp. UNC378MF]